MKPENLWSSGSRWLESDLRTWLHFLRPSLRWWGGESGPDLQIPQPWTGRKPSTLSWVKELSSIAEFFLWVAFFWGSMLCSMNLREVFMIICRPEVWCSDLILVKKFTRPNLWAKEFYTLKTRKLRLFLPTINSENTSLSVIWPSFG